MAKRIHIGVGGWTYAPWRGTFFPKGLRQADELAFASKVFTAIEVNGTYYRTQTPATFAHWASETPDGFTFALKAPRYVTTARDLAATGPSIQRFLESGLTELGPKLGPLNWQFLPTRRFDRDALARFLDLLPDQLNGIPLRHAIEARHESFDCPALADLLAERSMAVVLGADSPYPEIEAAPAPFAYLRLMGTREGVATGYPPEDLDRWAARVREIAKDREVFLFVIAGCKPANPVAAQELLQRLGSVRTPL